MWTSKAAVGLYGWTLANLTQIAVMLNNIRHTPCFFSYSVKSFHDRQHIPIKVEKIRRED